MPSLPLYHSLVQSLQPTNVLHSLQTIIGGFEGEVLQMQHSRDPSSESSSAILIPYLKHNFSYLLITVFISLNSSRMFCNTSSFDISDWFLFLDGGVMVGDSLSCCISVCIRSTSCNFSAYVCLDPIFQNANPKNIKVNFQTLYLIFKSIRWIIRAAEIGSHFA